MGRWKEEKDMRRSDTRVREWTTRELIESLMKEEGYKNGTGGGIRMRQWRRRDTRNGE